MIERSTDIKAALRSRQRGFLLNPFRFGSGGGGVDPHFDNVSLLLHFDGTSLPQIGGSIVDSSPRTKDASLIGNTELTSAASLYGSSGMVGVSGGGATATSHADFALPGDFTFETGFYINTATDGLFSLFNIGNYASGMLIRVRLNLIELFINGAETNIATTVSPFVYHRLAMSRISGTVHVALDGTEVGTLSNSGSIGAGAVRIGSSAHAGGEYINGFMDELRLTKGVGRYTGSYTPSEEPFPNS